jgi:hypothetical protein
VPVKSFVAELGVGGVRIKEREISLFSLHKEMFALNNIRRNIAEITVWLLAQFSSLST